MMMKPHHALLVFWYILEILFKSTAIPICLTWNTSNTHLTVECSVTSATDDIFIVDPVGEVRAQYIWEDKLRKRSTTYAKNLPFTTLKDYSEGKWSCRHGKEETTSQVSYTKSISPNSFIDISAENFKLNEGNWFKLACFSCWIPHMQGVDIFVNDNLEDSIRYHNGDCYHQQKLCTPEVCTCAAKGRSFTWTYISALPIVHFACVMRFQDEFKNTSFNPKAELTFDGTVFIKNYNANEPNSPSNTNSDDDEIDLGKGKENTYSEMLLRSSAPPICLTWKTSNTHLTVECSVMSVNDDIIIVDPVGKVRAQHMWENNLHKRSTIHGIPLLFTTSKDYNEGKWSCRHGKEETTSQVSYTKSISPNIDIDISAENFKLKEGNWFKLACSSCWIPHMQGVDIFVNDNLEDSIRYHNGDCYHKHKLCTPEVCTCAAKGRIFTWTYISTLPIVQFACVMRFQDEIKYTTFNHKAEITFDGTVFIKNYNVNEPHSPTDKSSDDDKIDSGKGGINTYLGGIGYWKLGIVVFAILGIAISIAILVWNHTQNRPH